MQVLAVLGTDWKVFSEYSSKLFNGERFYWWSCFFTTKGTESTKKNVLKIAASPKVSFHEWPAYMDLNPSQIYD